MTHVGIVASAGGASFKYGLRILESCGWQFQASVVTDRACEAEVVCRNMGLHHKRIEYASRDGFSKAVTNWLLDVQHVDFIMLFFSRMVSSILYDTILCVNFHPSLLPSFSGMGAVKMAASSDVGFIGATAHIVNANVDDGKILAQVVAPVSRPVVLEELERVSFAQKVYLFLVVCEMMKTGKLSTDGSYQEIKCAWANPSLYDKRISTSFEEFIYREKIQWIR